MNVRWWGGYGSYGGSDGGGGGGSDGDGGDSRGVAARDPRLTWRLILKRVRCAPSRRAWVQVGNR